METNFGLKKNLPHEDEEGNREQAESRHGVLNISNELLQAGLTAQNKDSSPYIDEQEDKSNR